MRSSLLEATPAARMGTTMDTWNVDGRFTSMDRMGGQWYAMFVTIPNGVYPELSWIGMAGELEVEPTVK